MTKEKDSWLQAEDYLPFPGVKVIVIDAKGDYGIAYFEWGKWCMAYTHAPVDTIMSWAYITPPPVEVKIELDLAETGLDLASIKSSSRGLDREWLIEWESHEGESSFPAHYKHGHYQGFLAGYEKYY